MLDSLSYEDFSEHLDSNFRVGEGPAELKLVEITERKVTAKQDMFSLIFAGAEENFLEQGIYLLNHETLGSGGIFLVPIAKDAGGYKYEAGFNRVLNG